MLCGWRWRSLAIPWLGMRNHDLGFPEALAQVVWESGGPWEFHWCYSLSEARLGAQITIILIYSSLKFNLFKQNLSLNGVYCVRQMSAFYLMRRIYLWLSLGSLSTLLSKILTTWVKMIILKRTPPTKKHEIVPDIMILLVSERLIMKVAGSTTIVSASTSTLSNSSEKKLMKIRGKRQATSFKDCPTRLRLS